jgi:DNA helicase-2/ATP-dependent DNA helicase PcrA
MVDLAKLNPPQREAVTHGGGPLLVLAGAGSGKTRVITYRIANLIARGIPPTAILAMTFTNKAAAEMRERIAKLIGDRSIARKLTIGTFHALGLSILKTERKALGLPGGFAIYDQSDQLGALREAARHVHDGERRLDVKAILTRISLAKNAFVAPEDYRPTNEADEYDLATRELYPRYQSALRACAAFDFDDLIVEPVRLFERDPDVRARWASQFRYVMVDEYQDTNRAQLRLIEVLVEQHGNLCVVGDDDQSIYSWRGADPTQILRFDAMFPGAAVIKLEQNYRSTRTILAAANAVIANNTQRRGKTLWSDLGAGEPIVHAVASTVEDEAKWVAREIARLKNNDGVRWSDVAILYRSNLQSKLLEDELRQAAVPYVMFGGQQFFERKEVKDVIAYLRVALNPRDDLSLRRVLNYPARGIGAQTVERLVATARARHAPMWNVLRDIAATAPLPSEELDDSPAADFRLGATEGDDLKPSTRKAIAGFVGVVSRLAAALESGTGPVAATRALIADIALVDDLRAASPSITAAQRRIDNVEGLIGSLARHQERASGRQALGEYLRQLSLESKDDESDATGERVVMTTLHGAKGLEFPICFLVGMEEELLPHVRTLQPNITDIIGRSAPEGRSDIWADHATDVSEERRLCYVGITRAQKKLYLTRACLRTSRGRTITRTPSRFLLEIPDELLDVRDLGEEARQKVPEAEVKSFFSSFSVDD